MEAIKSSKKPKGYVLPYTLRGRNIHVKVIPTVCNLKNMLHKLIQLNGNYDQLKQWEKRSYKAYIIDDIKNKILSSPESEWKDIIRDHILSRNPSDFGASLIDIYLVAYVCETNCPSKSEFFKYVINKGITEKMGSAQAIWQVGKGDGVYLGILEDDGRVMDWDFMLKWVNGV